ncbi:hypothetical protein FACS189413_14090 [Bacteroidia bacterium]|nr:hypothetical protein FACS189413_14090 [Bacteroidia bacterium]
MKHIFLYLLFFTTIPLFAQEVGYYYDEAGNRTERAIWFTSTTTTNSLRSSQAISAMEDIVARQAIKIYPNPTDGVLAVEIVDFSGDLQADLYLFDASGKEILRQLSASAYTTFNISNQPNGVYLLRIMIEGESVTWKIIKK